MRWTTNTAIKTANYTAVGGDVVLCDPSGGTFTVTIPLASGTDRMIVIKNVTDSTTAITLARTSSDTIDGATSVTMNLARQSVTMISNGSNGWMIT